MNVDHSHTPDHLSWNGDVPISDRFQDPYYSLDDGAAETRHVFMAGNDLPNRFCDGFHIAETGFGTGLNFLVALSEWRAAGIKGRLYFTSFEAFPLSAHNMRKAHETFPEFHQLSTEINWSQRHIILPDATLTIIEGDARKTLPPWKGMADAWFLDGFSPDKNPELWEDTLLQAVGHHTKPNGTCATYSAAGKIRRALQSAGFDIKRVSGFGRKRHMSIGTKKEIKTTAPAGA